MREEPGVAKYKRISERRMGMHGCKKEQNTPGAQDTAEGGRGGRLRLQRMNEDAGGALQTGRAEGQHVKQLYLYPPPNQPNNLGQPGVSSRPNRNRRKDNGSDRQTHRQTDRRQQQQRKGLIESLLCINDLLSTLRVVTHLTLTVTQ